MAEEVRDAGRPVEHPLAGLVDFIDEVERPEPLALLEAAADGVAEGGLLLLEVDARDGDVLVEPPAESEAVEDRFARRLIEAREDRRMIDRLPPGYIDRPSLAQQGGLALGGANADGGIGVRPPA